MPPRASTRSNAGKKAAAAKKPSKEKSSKKSGQEIRIRMYNVGFGDCFLVRIPTSGGERKILFDCGSIKKAKHAIDEIVSQVIKDVTDADGVPRIDVIVGTHRHRDHVSGFDDPVWSGVEVKEVWMPWTEDPIDPQARVIRETQSKLALALHKSFSQQQNAAGAPPSALERFELLALNALSNEGAMTTLHEGFTGKPLRRFMPTKNATDSNFTTAALPDVSVHVLGPSRDKDVIRDMDPPAGHSYLQMLDEDASQPATAPEPFNEAWWISPPEYGAQYPHLVVSPPNRKSMQKAGAEMEQAVAASLDSAVNGTSLMLVLRVANLHFLFPGDAQWGTWQMAMKNPDSLALLKRIDFLKVGHHGSHNATPVDFVENALGNNFWAMVSTASVTTWPQIPRGPLLDALLKRTKKLSRSDKPAALPGVFEPGPDNLYIDTSIPLV